MGAAKTTNEIRDILSEIEKLNTYYARLCNRVQSLEDALGRTVYDLDSERVVKKARVKKQVEKVEPEVTVTEVEADEAEVMEPAPEPKKARKKRTFTAEQRAAIGLRLKLGREAKAMGMTVEEYKEWLEDEGAQGEKETPAPKKPRTRKTAKQKASETEVEEEKPARKATPARKGKVRSRRKAS